MANVKFKYTEGKGTTPPPQSADPNALYFTNGRIYKGNVAIADLTPAWVNVIGSTGTPNDILISNGSGENPMWVSPNTIKVGRAAIADDLGDIEESVDSEYLMQPTAKDENIRDGYVHIQSLKGNSVVWNQYARKLDSSYASYYVVNSGFATSLVDNNTLKCDINELGKVEYYIDYMFQYIPNHKYLVLLDINSYTTASGLYVYYNTSLTLAYKRVSVINQWETLHLMFTPTESSASTRFRLYGGIGTSITETGTIYFRNPQIIDLTQMFQEGNEPTTIEEFERRKPQVADEYAYNEGEIISFDADAIKSVGFNQWDEEWENGTINQTHGDNATQDGVIRSKNFIPCLPNTKYYFKGYISWGVFFYDEHFKYLGRPTMIWPSNMVITTPTNARYFKFATSVANNHDVCINLSNPARNGTYEPYRQFTRNLPRRGVLRSAGAAFDEIYYNQDIRMYNNTRKFGEVDLGDLDWVKNSGGILANRYMANVSGIKPITDNTQTANILCNKYITTFYYNIIEGENAGGTVTDKTISQTSTSLLVSDSSYTDAATFKSAMKGVKLIYELAEPIETVLSDVEYMDYYVENGGTEQVLSENNTTPIRTTTVYNFDAVSTIRQNRFDVSELKSGYSSLSSKVSSAETNISTLTSYVAQNTTSIDNIVNGTTAVGKASKLNGYEFYSSVLYQDMVYHTNTSNQKWYVKVVMDTAWNSEYQQLFVKANYNNKQGKLLIEFDSFNRDSGFITRLSQYDGSNIEAYASDQDSGGRIIFYFRFREYTSCNCTVYSSMKIRSSEIVSESEVPAMSELTTKNIYTNYAVNFNGGTLAGTLKAAEKKGILLRHESDTYLAGIGYDSLSDECISLWAKSSKTRLRWNAGIDMSDSTYNKMMTIIPDFEISKASGTAYGYIGGSKILTESNYASYTYSQASIDSKLGSYLPLSGGTLKNSTNRTPLTIDTDNAWGPLLYLQYKGNTKAGIGVVPKDSNSAFGASFYYADASIAFLLGADGKPYFCTNSDTLSPRYEIIHSGNIASQSVAKATYATYIGDSNEQLGYQSLNDAIDQISALESVVDVLPETYSPLIGSASLTKYSGGTFGNAAAKNYTTSVQSGNANLVTSGAVYSYLASYAYKSDVPAIGIFMATSIQNGVLRCEYLNYFGEGGSWSGNDDIYDGDIIMIINPNNVNGNFTSWMDIDHNFEVECGTQCTIYSGSGITLAAYNYNLYPANYL